MSSGTEYLEQLLGEVLEKLAAADSVIAELVRDKVLIAEVNQLATAVWAVKTTAFFVARGIKP